MNTINNIFLSSTLLFATTMQYVENSDSAFISQKYIYPSEKANQYGEIVINYDLQVAKFTENSHLGILNVQCSFNGNAKNLLKIGTLSVQPMRFLSSPYPNLTYRGGMPYYIEGLPRQSSITRTISSKVSAGVDVKWDNKTEAKFDLDGHGTATMSKKSTTELLLNYENSNQITTPEPRLYTNLVSRPNSQYTLGYEWNIEFSQPIPYGYILDTIYIFEIDHDSYGTMPSDQVVFNVNAIMKNSSGKCVELEDIKTLTLKY